MIDATLTATPADNPETTGLVADEMLAWLEQNARIVSNLSEPSRDNHFGRAAAEIKRLRAEAAARPDDEAIRRFLTVFNELCAFEAFQYRNRGYGAFDRSTMPMPDPAVVEVVQWLEAQARAEPEAISDKPSQPASAIDIMDGILKPLLGSMPATCAALTVWHALRKAGLLVEASPEIDTDEEDIQPTLETSPATWRQRVDVEFKRLGGPEMPLSFDIAGLKRAEAVDAAKQYATSSMLDEIHATLRAMGARRRHER